jgi:hypothetical protein
MKLTEMKKMIKKDFNERYIYNLVRCEIEVVKETFGIITVWLHIGTKDYCIATESYFDNDLQVDTKQLDKVDKYVEKVRKSMQDVEEIDVKIIRTDK